jgi:hypothetical protein
MLEPKEVEERLAAFHDVTVNHPKLAELDSQVTAAIREKAGFAHLLIYGPSGVGKSTMVRHIQARFAASSAPNTVPIVKVEARTADTGYFSRLDYYRQVLTELGEHVVVKQILVNVQEPKSGRGGRAGAMDGLDLRDAMEEALRRMHVRAVVIDEAQVVMKVEKAGQLLDQLDWLKSMTNMTEVLHILVGTYSLLDFRNLSGQTARRGRDLHFARYHFEDEANRTAFLAAVKYLLERIGIPCDIEQILSHWQFLYLRSIGCIGVIKEWLIAALAAALDLPEPQLTWAVMEEHAPTVAQSVRMGADAKAGEQQLAKSEQSDGDLRALLGMPISPTPASADGTPTPPTKSSRGRGRPRKSATPS